MPLTPRAAEPLAREAADKAFAPAARSLNLDWETGYDGRPFGCAQGVQRWAEALGETVARRRSAEAQAFERGARPAGPANDPDLIVVGMDGGRVHGRGKGDDGKPAWHEDTVRLRSG